MILLYTVQNPLRDILVLSQCQYVIRFLHICGGKSDTMHQDQDELRKRRKKKTTHLWIEYVWTHLYLTNGLMPIERNAGGGVATTSG